MHLKGPVSSAHQRRSVEGLHGLDQVRCVLDPGGFVGRVHGQLRQPHVNRAYRHMGAGKVTQGGAPGNVRMVGKGLQGNSRLLADQGKDRTGNPVGGLALVGAFLHHYALVQDRAVSGIGLVGVVGMHTMSVVGRNQEAVGQQPRQRLGAAYNAA